MVPCLVPASTARAHNRVWVEAAAQAALARAITLGFRDDEAAFSAWKLCLVAGSGLPRQVDEGLGVAMVHQELTVSGGRMVVPGRVIGGSWKAG
jgi:hypothetical protein